jgi:hypothetical protein
MTNQYDELKEETKPRRGRPPKVKRTERPTRIPMSGSRKRMHIEVEDKDPNFHYAWINDQKDLIPRAKRAGYEHVSLTEMPSWGAPDVDSSDSTSSMVSMKVNEDTTAYLMKQSIEFYEEDQKSKNDVIDARESGMKQELNSGTDGKYGSVEFS